MKPFLHRMILTFGLIQPLGVQNIFIFNQGAIQKTFMRALPAPLTAGVSDTLLISLAFTGVSILILGFDWLRNLLFIPGFFFLMYMGWTLWKSKNLVSEQQSNNGFSVKRQITIFQTREYKDSANYISTYFMYNPESKFAGDNRRC